MTELTSAPLSFAQAAALRDEVAAMANADLMSRFSMLAQQWRKHRYAPGYASHGFDAVWAEIVRRNAFPIYYPQLQAIADDIIAKMGTLHEELMAKRAQLTSPVHQHLLTRALHAINAARFVACEDIRRLERMDTVTAAQKSKDQEQMFIALLELDDGTAWPLPEKQP